jgi:serine/threonine protein kinase
LAHILSLIEELLGEGSFAWVYRAHDQKFERYVALKLLKPIWFSAPQAVVRFEQEAKTMASLLSRKSNANSVIM